MSLPNTVIGIDADVPLEHIAELLCRPSIPHIGSPEARVSCLGGIGVYEHNSSGQDDSYGEYGPFKLVIHFWSSYEWYNVRFALVCELCSWLVEDFGGRYVVMSDNGAVHFITTKEGTVAQLKFEKSGYFSSLEPITFKELPTW